MSSIAEAVGNTQQNSTLRTGLETLDLSQVVTFQAYSRVVLPIDGYVFWQPTVKIQAKGNLHISQEFVQNEDESLGVATIVFTSESRVAEFESSPVNTIFVARFGAYRYAFSSLQPFNGPAELWHYFGRNIAPAMASQLLDSPTSIDPARAITSNSLPLWLSLNNYVSPYYDGFSNAVTLYPSFLTPQNLVPPYGAVHIPPESTRALQAVPYLSRNRSHHQLVTDHVRITLYGLQSDEALDFIDCIMQYSLNTDHFGIMNMPVVVDGKRPQAELQAIAMQKIIDLDISYYQNRVATVARQLILSAVPTITVV